MDCLMWYSYLVEFLQYIIIEEEQASSVYISFPVEEVMYISYLGLSLPPGLIVQEEQRKKSNKKEGKNREKEVILATVRILHIRA